VQYFVPLEERALLLVYEVIARKPQTQAEKDAMAISEMINWGALIFNAVPRPDRVLQNFDSLCQDFRWHYSRSVAVAF
jgi:hypothetical protein